MPQGSGLGPTPFSLYTNYFIPDAVDYASVYMYADDTTIFVYIAESVETVFDMLNKALMELQNYFSNNFLSPTLKGVRLWCC